MKTYWNAVIVFLVGVLFVVLGFLRHNPGPVTVAPPSLPGGITLPTVTTPTVAEVVKDVAPVVQLAAKAVPALAPVAQAATVVQKFEAQPTALKVVEGVAAAAIPAAVVAVVDKVKEEPANEPATSSAPATKTPTVPGPISPKVTGHLLVGANVQAALVANVDHAVGYAGVFQWLKWGTTNDPRNLRFAFLSPAFFFSPNVHELGYFPLSWNVATAIPHQPFTNVWLSLYLGGNPKSPSRVGGAISWTW